jgi:type III secretion protein Q
VNTLPLALPILSRGFAALTPSARAEGRRAAEAAGAALSDVLGVRVGIEARPLPGPARPCVGFARALLVLGGIGGTAALEIETGLLARALDRLATRSPRTPAALAASELEQALLALLTLVAIDAATVSPRVDALLPRVAVDGDEAPAEGLAIALDFTVGEDRGRGQLVLPTAALARLGTGTAPEPTAAASGVAFDASLRRGTASLALAELAALAPGDVVLVDDGPPRTELVLPGGLALRGSDRDSLFRIEEIRMTEAQAAYPLTLSVEIGRVTVTLGELARLEPGAALPLDARKDGAVVLRAGERAIARGQLVDIEGALGVRIAQVGDLP